MIIISIVTQFIALCDFWRKNYPFKLFSFYISWYRYAKKRDGLFAIIIGSFTLEIRICTQRSSKHYNSGSKTAKLLCLQIRLIYKVQLPMTKRHWSWFISKGQLIPKANSLVLIWTKNRTKLFFDFCPSL